MNNNFNSPGPAQAEARGERERRESGGSAAKDAPRRLETRARASLLDAAATGPAAPAAEDAGRLHSYVFRIRLEQIDDVTQNSILNSLRLTISHIIVTGKARCRDRGEQKLPFGESDRARVSPESAARWT